MKKPYNVNVLAALPVFTKSVLTVLLTLVALISYAQVGVGTTTPDPSAQLDVTSDAKGVLIPRLTSQQRIDISAPADGLLVYDTETKGFWFFKIGTGWTQVTTQPFALPFAGNASNTGSLFAVTSSGTGTAIEGITTTAGAAAHFQNTNTDNIETNVLTVESNSSGNIPDNTKGNASSFIINNSTSVGAAVRGEVKTIFGNFGAAAIFGTTSGTGGYGGLFYSSNTQGNGPAVVALTRGNGNGITTNAAQKNGIEASTNGAANAVYGWIPSFGTGKAAYFANTNDENSNHVVHINNVGTGHALLVNHAGSAGNLAVFQNAGANVARISKTGVGYFNGGAQTGGADIAEAFDVVDSASDYEPGDVLSIATSKDRTIEKSVGPYSTLVLGVYATKPGVLLTEENIDSNLAGKVPMGVVGVIPTKVCQEGGIIQRGDLLVTSSIPGVAMKADKTKIQPGQILGKALQNYDGDGVGKINVFVNVK